MPSCLFFFFFNDTATTEIYTLSLHDALPIFWGEADAVPLEALPQGPGWQRLDRKSTRLNSSHGYISYAVFCLKKKKSYHPHAAGRALDEDALSLRKTSAIDLAVPSGRDGNGQ